MKQNNKTNENLPFSLYLAGLSAEQNGAFKIFWYKENSALLAYKISNQIDSVMIRVVKE